MEGFVRLVARLSIVAGIGMGILLLLLIGTLIYAPEKLFQFLYYGLILICIGVLVYLVLSLVKIGLSCLRMRMEHRDISKKRREDAE